MKMTVDTSNSEKGRAFSAQCLAFLRFKEAEPEPDSDAVRPVWAMFASTETQLRPFVANAATGRAFTGEKRVFSFLKSKGFKTAWQRVPSGMVATVYRQDLFITDPGMVDASKIQFVLLPPESSLRPDNEVAAFLHSVVGDEWVTKTNAYEQNFDPHYLAAVAPVLSAYLDRRTLFPMIPDHRFYALLLASMLEKGLASLGVPDQSYRGMYQQPRWGHSFGMVYDPDKSLKTQPIFVNTQPALFAEVLAATVKEFVKRT